MKINKEVFIGNTVYFFSSKLNEIITGVVEGFYTEDYSIVKILQKVSDGSIRHIIPMNCISKDLSEIEVIAARMRREKINEDISKQVYAGCVVNLKDPDEGLVCDSNGNPFKYQVIAVYAKQARVKLVTDYGEEIGMYNIEDLFITEEGPLFKMEDYVVGQQVVWAEYDEVYEGIISKLHSSTAEVSDIKKLFPLDVRKKVPFYKLSNNKINNESTTVVLTTIKDIIPEGEGE